MHDFFVPLLETAAAGCTVSVMPEAIRTQGNCIPLALARLTSAVEVAESQVKVLAATNTAAAVRASAAAETGLLSSSLYWCHHTTSKSRVQAHTWCMQRWQASRTASRWSQTTQGRAMCSTATGVLWWRSARPEHAPCRRWTVPMSSSSNWCRSAKLNQQRRSYQRVACCR